MTYSLVVVDMQPYFPSARDFDTVEHVEKLVGRAITDKAAIIFLEYYGCGKTDPTLRNAVSDYKRAFFVQKDYNDGSREVIATIRKHNLPKRKIKVCGVNTDACVKSTVMGFKRSRSRIMQINKRIEISQNGTNSSWYHTKSLEDMSKLPGCVLID